MVIPLLLGVMFSYALTPLVQRLERLRLPRAAGAGLVLVVILSALGLGRLDPGRRGERLHRDAAAGGAGSEREAGRRASQFGRHLRQGAAGGDRAGRRRRRRRTRRERLAAAAATARRGAAAAALGREPTVVVLAKPRFNIRDYLWTGTLGLLAFIGQATIVVFITFFLLASGSTFRRKMVRLAGPTLGQKKITVQALDEIGAQIQRYLLVQLATSAIVGVLTGLAFLAIGLNNAAVWGVVAGVTNLIPYIGAILVGGASAVVGFIQFGSIDMGVLVGAASFFVHMLVGNLLTPWWMGRASRMNPFVVFVAVLLFGWLWGIWGLLLGVPIVVVVKTVCDRVDELKPIGELLGG